MGDRIDHGTELIGVPGIVPAVPKGPAGQARKSSGTATVNGKEEGTGKAMKCTLDCCKYDECETCGPNIGKCYESTSYSNVRDCKVAARTMNPRSNVPPGQLAPLTVNRLNHRSNGSDGAPKGGVIRHGAEGESSAPRRLWKKKVNDRCLRRSLTQAVHFTYTKHGT